jgi:hypothetical protein
MELSSSTIYLVWIAQTTAEYKEALYRAAECCGCSLWF